MWGRMEIGGGIGKIVGEMFGDEGRKMYICGKIINM